ncbi:SIS domain-containing protein [Proteobacteria bacterium 005FR1]|nr:SIS domain-containing protein [Proteobacteria bacterium 005FR1]
MAAQTLLEALTEGAPKLSKSDQKVASVIVSQPSAVIHYSIARLADLAGVSEPTVSRLCHKLGCEGYTDFKLRLAQELSSGGRLYVENMEATDDTRTIINKILSSIETSIRSMEQSISPGSIESATALLASSRSIYFFGSGASGPVALDAQHKFFRFGIPVVAQTDYVNQRMMCSMLGPDDAAIFISYTGRTREIIASAALASERGARTIGLTQPDSPLARHCMEVLNVVALEDTDLYTPMTSRIIHLATIDILATTLALALGDKVETNIRAIKRNLQATRCDG